MSEAEAAVSARIELEWGGEDRVFWLKLGEIEKLEVQTGFGVARLMQRIVNNEWRYREVALTLRLGLEGSGMAPTLAKIEIERYCAPGNLTESLEVAMLVLHAVVDATRARQLGEARAKRMMAVKTPPGGSPSPGSTPAAS